MASLIESASDAVVGVSPAGLLTSWSEGAERLFGYSRTEIVGRSVLVLSPGEHAEKARSLLEHVQRGERVERVDTERVAKDGTLLRLLVSVSPIRGRDGEFAGAVGIYRDLSEQRDAEEALRASERRYQSVVEALNEGVVMQDVDGRVVASNTSAERILGLSAEELVTSSAERPLLALIHEDGSPFLGHEHPAIVSVRTGKPQNGIVMGVKDTDGSTRWISINSSALVRPDEEEPYASVASFTDITELRDTLEELHDARLEDLQRLAMVGEYRDDDTNRHTERVARTAELLASNLGLEAEHIWRIHRGAPLHDVGKIGIPDRILLKPGKLTAEEFEVIKTHTVIGGRILSESRFPILQTATEIAFTHHEHWDGTGYPAGLQGRGIPIAGRIVAVADAFDAMTHARPYKAAFSVEHAVAEIKRCGGTQFDPQVVEAFMTLDHDNLVEADCQPGS
jgi:putative two-component system response regulator